ncbi:hypothetical protein [Jiella mangrovi]|uniref:Uncharacterized protein n=1 Tax=Jiella mangrovi TaxID=2821407 RepID=A0ABS4BG54_9HYPH|nr:hypothetical protein [Jiella mangrovi]MBP0614915.1 hypothetical protein [Jiella mangrovi]
MVTMMRQSRFLRALAILLVLLLSAMPAAAAAWRFDAGEAGLWVDGQFNGFVVGCSGSAVTLSFFGFPARLETGMVYSVVVTIDGTARRFRAKAGTRPGAPGSALVASISGGEAATLIDALRRGRKAEIAAPAGRYDLPLAGSSKALGAMGASCPAAS